MTLIQMQPRGDLSSTGYALASPGHEYLVLQPGEDASFTIALAAGSYLVEWFSVNSRETRRGDTMTVQRNERVSFTAPFTPEATHIRYRVRR
jgi:hypothetical protein